MNESPFLPEEAEVIQEILAGEYPEPPVIEEVDGLTVATYQHEHGTLKFSVDPSSGHVVAFEAEGASVRNDGLRKLQGLPGLETIKFGHWGNWHDKSHPAEAYDGSGLEGISILPITTFHVGGSMFNEAGFQHVAKIKALRDLTLHHVKVSEESLKQLIGHPNLEKLEISSKGQPQFTNSTIPILAQIPNLKDLSIHESYLTYDGGLEALAPLAGQLERIFFRYPLILKEDVEKLKAAFPDTEVVIHGFQSLDQGHPRSFKKWVPPEVIEQFKAENGL